MTESALDTGWTRVGDGNGGLDPSSLRIAVYGLGRTGLTLSVLCARLTPVVTAAGTDSTRVAELRQGSSPVSDPLLSEYVTEATDDDCLRATADLPAAAAEATVHLVAVRTGLRADDAPDLSTLRATVRDIGRELSAGDTVVVTTPVPPGTTEGVVESTLADESGLTSEEFGLAVCALPTDRSLRSIRAGDLVVAGTDTRSRTIVAELFSALTTGTVSTTPRVTTAECVDAVERTAAEMLQSLSNELAVSAPGIEVPTVAELVSVRSELPVPGPGVDGSEPVGAGFLTDAVTEETPVLDSVYRSTRQFPELIADTVLSIIDSQPTAAGGAETADGNAGDDPADGGPTDAATDEPASDGPADTEPAMDTQPTVLIVGVPTPDERSTADRMPLSVLIRELTRAETRPLVCDPVADLPRSLTPHAVSIRGANRLDPDAVVVLSYRLVFEELDWAAYDETVVIDCCGADLEAVDTAVHRLGGAETLRRQ